MRKSAIYIGLLGLAVAGAGLVLADEIPQALRTAPAPRTTATAKPAPASASSAANREHMQGMDHGAQQMHDRMMHDHQMGIQNMQDSSGSATPSQGPMSMPTGKSCCPDKPTMPVGKPMPMKDM